MRHREDLTIAINLDRRAGRPLPEQLADQLRAAIDAGMLARHTRMPSTRTLGTRLQVSRGVTVAAYDLLCGRGYVEGRHGSGTYVAAGPVPAPRPGPAPMPDERPDDLVDLTPGQPCAEAFPLPAWRAAWRRASYQRPPTGRLPAHGLPQLRHAIAAHLAGTRRAVPAGHQVVVTTGAAHSLRIVLAALGHRGAAVAIEDPVPPELRRAATHGTAGPLPLPVDGQGARLDAVRPGCAVVVLSAEAHVPLGHVLSTPRRRAVADWAGRTGGHVVEIAAETVPRPTGPDPLSRLLDAAGRARFVLVGGFGALLTPSLHLGYAVVPRDLAGQLAVDLADSPEQPSYLTQLAVADLLAGGVLRRLTRRLAGIDARKRQLVRAVLEPLRGRVELVALDAVGTVGLRLPHGPSAGRAAGELARRGLLVHTLGRYCGPAGPAADALLLGYPQLPDPALRGALTRLTDVLTHL
ncbi:PLP-dependent aminotransferase family protein [Micromonospora sp. NPDC092111]|uniref:aminotransferase-like domain-containing protein n=1 Tax=Micromonospora sp. NPDC092111 TaxID=3364289 RepID=UPI0038227A1B